MPRNSSGNYNLPVAAFVPGGLIKSADLNSNFSDIATAMTQSLATTGVSTMTGPFNAAAGSVVAPSITFNGASHSGFYLAGTDQIGWASAGVQGATFNSDLSVTWNGIQTFNASVFGKGTVPIGTMVDYGGASAPSGWLLCFGQLVSTTTYASLFTALGTTYGSGGGTFGIPDYRGRTGFGKDDMGGVAASRITVAGGNFDGTGLGNSGGGQNQTLTLAQLPGLTASQALSISVASSGQATTVPGAASDVNFAANISAGGGINIPTTGNGNQYTAVTGFAATVAAIVAGTGNGSGGGAAAAHTILSPAIIANKIIYAGI